MAGGSVGEKTILVSEVPQFTRGGTYIVFAYDASRLYHSAVVGVEQGMFQEVTDGRSGERILVDRWGRRMERGGEGELVRGRPTRFLDADRVVVQTDEELVETEQAHRAGDASRPWPQPVVRDGNGRVLPAAAAPRTARATAVSPEREPATREHLRSLVTRALAARVR